MHIDISHLAIYVGQVSIKDWIDVLSALLTPIVTIIAVYIAYRQWKTAEAKRRQDLFEMRYDNLFNLIIKNSARYLEYKRQNFENIDIEEKERQDNHYQETLSKYKFLITKKDFDILIAINIVLFTVLKKRYEIQNDENTSNENKEKQLNALNKDVDTQCNLLDELSDKYLRIEK